MRNNEQLVNRVKELWSQNLKHAEILKIVTEDEGWKLDSNGLKTLRRKHGLTTKKTNIFTELAANGEGPDAEQVLERVKHLWGKNLSHQEMFKVLTEDDGWEISETALETYRRKHGLLMRKRDPFGELLRQAESAGSTPQTPNENSSTQTQPDSLQEMTQIDAQRYGNRQVQQGPTRRGRARHSTKSDGTSSRFPSEMTVEESRLILCLDDKSYREMTARFKDICRENSVLKKTDIMSFKWERMKQQLAADVPQLTKIMVTFPDNFEAKKHALEIICSYVTKNLRNASKKITLPDAKNILGLNPLEGRKVREYLYQILLAVNFTTKNSLGHGQWDEIERRWGEKSDIIARALAVRPHDPGNKAIRRALDVTAKDVFRRFQERKRQLRGPQPKETLPCVPISLNFDASAAKRSQRIESPDDPGFVDMSQDRLPDDDANDTTEMSRTPQSSMFRAPGVQIQHQRSPQPSGHHLQQMQALQTMESTATPPAQINTSTANRLHQNMMSQQHIGQQYVPAASNYTQQPQAMAAYIRLHPSSTFIGNTNLWIAALSSRTVREVQRLATEKNPGAVCVRIEGIVKDGNGGELPLMVNDNQELEAYLQHLQGTAPTFSVQLDWET